MAENGRLRVSRTADDRYFTLRPEFEADKFVSRAIAMIRNTIDNIGESGKRQRQQSRSMGTVLPKLSSAIDVNCT